MKSPQSTAERATVISPVNFERAKIKIVGAAPLVQHAFSEKTRLSLEAQHREGSKRKNKNTKEPRDFEGDYPHAAHVSREGWNGHPAGAFRNAAISACRVAGLVMTKMKLSFFVNADGYDANGTPLVRIYGEPQIHKDSVRNETGVVDIRWRPMWIDWHALNCLPAGIALGYVWIIARGIGAVVPAL